MAKRNEKKEKKKYAEPEMGYCPFEHKAGLGTGLGVQVGARDARSRRRRQAGAGHRRWALGRWVARARGRQARGTRQAARPRRAAGPVGCALGALSLFLARFDSILFLSRFLDIVREPGS